jgi:hypothetical protein
MPASFAYRHARVEGKSRSTLGRGTPAFEQAFAASAPETDAAAPEARSYRSGKSAIRANQQDLSG